MQFHGVRCESTEQNTKPRGFIYIKICESRRERKTTKQTVSKINKNFKIINKKGITASVEYCIGLRFCNYLKSMKSGRYY